MAKGGAAQPISTCPDITCTKVAVGVPVATALMSTPAWRINAMVARLDEEPSAEKAMVFPAASFRERIGDWAGTYQNRSSAPVMEAAIGRMGAPLAKALKIAAVPVEMAMSALPEISACMVSPPPDV